MFHEPPPSSRAGGGRRSAAQRNEAGRAFERPRPGQRSLPSALGNAGSCRSYRGDHARRPDVRNLNPCASKRLNRQHGFQWLPLLLKPRARPGHTGEQTCFGSQIWGVRGCTRHGSALFLAKEEGCSQAIAQELLTHPQRMWMEGQFGPKYPHPALDLLVKTYTQHITNRDSHSTSQTGTAHVQASCWGTPAPKISRTQNASNCIQSPESKDSKPDLAPAFLPGRNKIWLACRSVASGSCGSRRSADCCYHTPKSPGDFKARDLITTSEILCVYKSTQPRRAYHLALTTLMFNNFFKEKEKKKAQVPIPLCFML